MSQLGQKRKCRCFDVTSALPLKADINGCDCDVRFVAERTSEYRTLRSAFDPGCVKTRLSQGRAELFSQLPSPNRSCQCNRFSTTTKSRRKFYAQVQRRSFHTAWVKS